MHPSPFNRALSAFALVSGVLLSGGLSQAAIQSSGRNQPGDVVPARFQSSDVPRRVGSAATSSLPENQARCLGAKKVLVLRVDFSDVPGEPVTIDQATRVLDTEVKPFLERSSYKQTTIVSTISSKVYRLPATARSYYTEPASDGFAAGRSLMLYDDAIAAAKADYAEASYDRIIIALSPEMHKLFPEAKWNTVGQASQAGKEMWINAFDFATVAHELCHTYGASHSHRWQGTATDPIASEGECIAYGDPTDVMGDHQTPDHDLAPFQKYLCGWLPDSAVQGVTESGTYRVYRFDAADTVPDKTLALRFSRDGMRHYWIGLRGGVTPGVDGALAKTATGAYIGFAYQSNDSFYLLDLCPSYLDTNEIALPAATAFNDVAAGVSIRVIGSGGSGAQSYLDVEIKLSGAHSIPTMVGWGSTQSYESSTGVNPPVPAITVAGGDYHTVVLNPDGTVAVKAVRGMILMGAEVVPSDLKDVVSVAAGRYTSGAVRRDGTIAIWGDNSLEVCSPPQGLSNVRQLVLTEWHGLALRADGTVVGWPLISKAANVPASLRDVVAIAATKWDGFALKRDGTLVVWGTNADSIQAKTKFNDFAAVAASSEAAVALRANGSVVVLYGSGASSTIGQVPADLKAKAIGVADLTGFALRGDGSAVGWGGRIYSSSGGLPFHEMKNVPPPGVRFKMLGGGGVFHGVGLTEGVGSPVLSEVPIRDGNDLLLSWQGASDAVGYHVEISSQSTFAGIQAGTDFDYDAHTATAACVNALDPLAQYYYRVRSVGANGEMSLSNIGVIAPANSISVGTPANQRGSVGGSVTLSVTTPPGSSCRWQQNGTPLTAAAGATVSLANFAPENAGLYSALVTNGTGARLSVPAIVGVQTSQKVVGAGKELQGDILHPNGKTFDQVLITGSAESITADPGQVTRTSFIDLDGDIVQVEFSGAGTLSLILNSVSGPAAPAKYNQPSASYMKGHAGIVITGADAHTNVSIFTVGRATAYDPTGKFNITLPISTTNDPKNNLSPLFDGHDATEYDGVADIAFIAIASIDGKFGGVRTANTQYFASRGLTGIYAPGVTIEGPLYIGNISAFGTAKPVMLVGSAIDVRITGGDMQQDNGQPVQIRGITQLKFTDGSDSHGNLIHAQRNEAKYEQDGADVTSTVVLNP